jgi:glucosamine-6-phosphate deaminase
MSASYGKTEIVITDDYEDLGSKAATEVADVLRTAAQQKPVIRAVFAAGESQGSFLSALAEVPGIPWERIDCFNIDDFWEPEMPRHFTCGHQTMTQLYDRVRPKRVSLVDYAATDPQAESRRFEDLLRQGVIDVLCQGIGTSGHLALDEPYVSDFDDPRWVRVVAVAEQSKIQLRADPNFRDLGYIPEFGITMTVPAIVSAKSIFTMVPLGLKKVILTRLAATESPTPALPASILRTVPGRLFVDRNSCPDAWNK